MRALTLSQPWATIVAAGLKPIENRPWPLWPKMLGQIFAIHAGAKYDDKGHEWIKANFANDERVMAELFRHHQHGKIIGVARAVACIKKGMLALNPAANSRWFFGPFGFVLSDVRAVEPIPCKGALGFWKLPEAIEKQLMEVTA